MVTYIEKFRLVSAKHFSCPGLLSSSKITHSDTTHSQLDAAHARFVGYGVMYDSIRIMAVFTQINASLS